MPLRRLARERLNGLPPRRPGRGRVAFPPARTRDHRQDRIARGAYGTGRAGGRRRVGAAHGALPASTEEQRWPRRQSRRHRREVEPVRARPRAGRARARRPGRAGAAPGGRPGGRARADAPGGDRAGAREERADRHRAGVAGRGRRRDRAPAAPTTRFSSSRAAGSVTEPVNSAFSGAPEGELAPTTEVSDAGVLARASSSHRAASCRFGSSAARATTDGTPSTLLSPAYETRLGVELRQPLLRDRAVDAARLSIRVAAADRDARRRLAAARRSATPWPRSSGRTGGWSPPAARSTVREEAVRPGRGAARRDRRARIASGARARDRDRAAARRARAAARRPVRLARGGVARGERRSSC